MPGIHPHFFQEGPSLENTFESDDLLKTYLKCALPSAIFKEIEPDLKNFGARCAGDLLALSNAAEAEEPKHIPFDPWGRRIDVIQTSNAWEELQAVSAKEGLIAIGYERKQKEFSRVYQFTKLFLFHPSSAFMTCPLAMTDGATRVVELHAPKEVKDRALGHLTSRDPKQFWTSGQWMTERTGGSDVSGTSTIAKKTQNGFSLHGDKWFTSATTSQMTMALGKVEGATDSREGLSLFFVELRDSNGKLKNIRINRLKEKLGTKALPTAELTLEGTPGILIGEVGEGVKKVASLLNITRLYNSVTAIGAMARALSLAKNYAQKREAFGKKLSEQPLHLQTLGDLKAEYEAVFHLVFHLIHLLGRDETGAGSASETAILRLMTPVIKLWSAKQSVALVSEIIESFGGAGYIEDTGLPRMLRDSQVFSIWEGTTNVLSLDALRAIAKENALLPFFAAVEERLKSVTSTDLEGEVAQTISAITEMKTYFKTISSLQGDEQQAGARAFAFGLARIAAGSLLLEFAEKTASSRPVSKMVAKRFFKRPLTNLVSEDDHNLKNLSQLVYG